MTRPGFTAAAVGMAAAVLATGGLSSPASADDPAPTLVECAGTYSATYSPGLTATARPNTFTAHGTFGPCLSTLGPDFASAQVDNSGAGELSCLAGGNSTGSGSITWAGGQESELTFTGAIGLRPLGVTVLVLSGTITDGALEGADFLVVLPLLTTDLLNCFTTQGLTTMAGPISMTITPL